MKAKQIVRWSNWIGIISISLLLYWVFIFLLLQVFELKVFQENITQTFYASIGGILALMAGALMVSIMFNLSRIADKHNGDENITTSATNYSKVLGLAFLLSFPIIAGLLFFGDHRTKELKRQRLISAAQSLIEANQNDMRHLLDYRFEVDWVNETTNILSLLSKTDRNFPSVHLIIEDEIRNTPSFLGFYHYQHKYKDSLKLQKENFIHPTTKEERSYLKRVLKGNNEPRYSASDGKYELFQPFEYNGKRAVLYFSEWQNYGKIGS